MCSLYDLILACVFKLSLVCREKEKERKRQELEALATIKRSSSRVESLKRSQEEKDRQLALMVNM
jgi:hypothetical protein